MNGLKVAVKRARNYFPHNIAWLLVFMSAMYQVGFILPVSSAHNSMLYISLFEVHPMLPFFWALPGVIAILLGITGMFVGQRWLNMVASTVNVILWVFAFIVYIQAGIYFLAFAIAFVQMCFWAWNFTMREIELSNN